jgi:hypothetical protein
MTSSSLGQQQGEKSEAPQAMTEQAVYAMLEFYVCRAAGNGPKAVIAPGVRSASGFDARRTLDAVSLQLWPSSGMLLDGYEIKVSRSDWLRELKNPAKAQEFVGLVDRLWLVVSDEAIVKDGELPESWGLLAAKDGALRLKHRATRLADDSGLVTHPDHALPARFSRSFLVPLMRAVAAAPNQAGLVLPHMVPATQQSGDGLEAELRKALIWALGWIEYSAEVPLSDEEADAYKLYLTASALVDHQRGASGGGGE